MKNKLIEGMLASPPERDELVVQLFLRDGGQWGEIYRQDGGWWIELYQQSDGQPWRFEVEEVIEALSLSLQELRQRLEAPEETPQSCQKPEESGEQREGQKGQAAMRG